MAESSMEPEAKRRLMARFRSQDTKPEIAVRRLLHRLGYRFRIHVGRLPGKPDIALPKYRTAIFVHGCFWHRHAGCKVATVPKTRQDFWQAKFEGNIQRDRRNASELEAMGWQVIIVWECETRDIDRVAEALESALRSRSNARQLGSGTASEGDR
ncbi:hypothetical protein ATE62_14640 [Sphingopyxis sp. HIX]|nr:hypothetical protein ATE62_14640 [Sphingopyxis sp. HIX]KTE83822.1 hypothetical protein ATE72_11795 [Sphingopyxis sp. HXXIV]